MAQINAAAVARLNADPATTKMIQNSLGLPPTGVWDDATDAAFSQFQVSEGRDVNFGVTGAASEWEGLTAALRNRATPDTPNPALTDPAYAAFLRQMNVSTAQIKNEIMARTEAVTRAVNRNAAGYEMQKAESNKNTALGFEDRGLVNSGAQIQEQQKNTASIDYQRNQSEAAQSDALTEANRNASNQLADLGRQRAEQEYAARSRLGQKRAESVFNPLAVS